MSLATFYKYLQFVIAGSNRHRGRVGRHTANLLDVLHTYFRDGRQAVIGQKPCQAQRYGVMARTMWGLFATLRCPQTISVERIVINQCYDALPLTMWNLKDILESYEIILILIH